MAPLKNSMDKAAWSWADNTDPKAITKNQFLTAYRITLPKCNSSNCRRKCRGNPYCISGLGESSLNNGNQDHTFNREDFEIEKREEGLFVGLKNLGATCYVNSLLQLWFHNPVFRNAIFDWVSDEDPDEITNTSLTIGDEYVPQSVVGHLQQLFSLLKFSKSKYIDPTTFIGALGLDTATQQDAQEFSKLFISLLESKLSYQTLPHVRDLVVNNFRGQYSYVTRCCKCETESVSPSFFYELELNLKTRHTLAECLNEFLKEEKLDGSNCYHCSICNEKQEALRFINLKFLPPVLNLQLLRFVYDRQKGYKKKVTSTIQFPLKIDMGEYLEPKPKTPCFYNLSAVLIHKGASANSGHYVAHIKNSMTDDWYMFNDENVQKIEGKKLKLSEDDEKSNKPPKRVPKEFLSSNNAYMLVYTQENYKPPDNIEKELNPQLQKYVEAKNKDFEDWYDNLVHSKQVDIELKGEKFNMYKSMVVSEDCDLENIDVISLEWFSQWLKDSEANLKPIDHTNLLCYHSCLDPDKVKNCKYISSDGATELYNRYGGGPRLRGVKSICERCVQAKCELLHSTAKTLAEQKEITQLLKPKSSQTDVGYLVDRSSLQSWRKKVMVVFKENYKTEVKKNFKEEEENKDEEQTDQNVETEKCESEVKTENKEETNGKNGKNNDDKPDEESDESEDNEIGFNENIICRHGNLTIDSTFLKVVPVRVWEILHSYFPNAPTFKSDALPCQKCQELALEDEAVQKKCEEQALIQKRLLKDLFVLKNRPKLMEEMFYLIPYEEFFESWKKFIRYNGKKVSPPTSLNVDILLCTHDKLKYDIESSQDKDKVLNVTEQEWEVLNKFYPSKTQVVVNKDSSTTPELCSICLELRVEDERKALLHYERAKVVIRYSAPSQMMYEAEDSSSDQNTKSLKRMKLNGETEYHDDSNNKKKINKNLNINGTVDIRRSTRRRRTPGEKVATFMVSSSFTLRDLKCKIMESWGVAPFDQHLTTIEGKPLDGDNSTLGSLGVYPDEILLLQVDEPSEDVSLIDEKVIKAAPEAGFKGTELLRSM